MRTAHAYKGKIVIQCNLEGDIIREFSTVAEASRTTMIPTGNISKAGTHKDGRTQAGGFIWRYAN